MKVHIASDIHLEFGHVPHLTGGDLLLLCGDTVVADRIVKESSNDYFVARTFFEKQVSKYARCLVLMGNHEHYHGVFEDSATIYRRFLAKVAPHAKLLDNETEVIDGVAFVGSTLWAPCRGHNPLIEIGINQGMNDFRMIRKAVAGEPKATQRFKTSDARAHHEAAVSFIEAEVKKHPKVVVLTHHAPSLRSNTKYQANGHWDADALTSAYCSDLDGIMHDNRHISHWLHGHTHHNVDYRVASTRVTSNMHGYWGHERISREFDAERGAFEI